MYDPALRCGQEKCKSSLFLQTEINQEGTAPLTCAAQDRGLRSRGSGRCPAGPAPLRQVLHYRLLKYGTDLPKHGTGLPNSQFICRDRFLLQQVLHCHLLKCGTNLLNFQFICRDTGESELSHFKAFSESGFP